MNSVALKPINKDINTLDLADTTDELVYDVRVSTAIYPQITTLNGTWGTGVITVQVSDRSNGNWQTPPAGSLTYTTAGFKDAAVTKGVSFVRFYPSTANGSSMYAYIDMNAINTDV